MINIIVAAANDGAIGRGGDQPFYIRADLRRFKALTMGHPVLMGRRTFEALPRGPLPGRTNIVLTRDSGFAVPGATVAHDVAEMLRAGVAAQGGDEIFVIGGASLYHALMPRTDRIYMTRIYADVPDADTWLDMPAAPGWEAVEESERFTDADTGLEYQYITYERR